MSAVYAICPHCARRTGEPTVTCPACGGESVYSRTEDRYFHADGSDNRTCWLIILRGEVPT